MNEEEFWKDILSELKKGRPVVLVEIIERKGSAPNAEGAKMFVTLERTKGTVGGGVSEYKLTNIARTMLIEKKFAVQKIYMEHTESAQNNKSGMICSGSQTFAIVPLSTSDISTIEQIVEAFSKAKPAVLTINNEGIKINFNKILDKDKVYSENNVWQYQENVGVRNRIFIIGGGHVSLVLSKIMQTLDFHITVLDDREDLGTMKENKYANEKLVISYSEIEKYIPEGKHNYVAIMTFGHKSDELVLEKLINKQFKYIGLMASKAKKKQLFTNLAAKGITNELLEKVHSPIGISINSITPEEIAISIAAEIISIKNADK